MMTPAMVNTVQEVAEFLKSLDRVAITTHIGGALAPDASPRGLSRFLPYRRGAGLPRLATPAEAKEELLKTLEGNTIPGGPEIGEPF